MLFGGKINLSDNSKKLYTSKLRILNDKKEIKDTKFLKNTDLILEKINKYENPNTRRSFFIACVSALADDKNKKIYDIYHNKMMESNKILNKESHKSEKTKEKQSAITQEQLIEKQKELMANITSKDNEKLMNLLLVSLYTLVQPRRALDYSCMIVDKPKEDGNYYYKGKFYFRNYKTKDKYGEQIEHVPDELQKIIKIYMKYKKFPESKYLLHTRDKPEIKASDMNGLLKKAFGMNVGVSVLRNVFASDKYSSIVNDLAQDSKAMGTSVDVLLNTYIKK